MAFTIMHHGCLAATNHPIVLVTWCGSLVQLQCALTPGVCCLPVPQSQGEHLLSPRAAWSRRGCWSWWAPGCWSPPCGAPRESGPSCWGCSRLLWWRTARAPSSETQGPFGVWVCWWLCLWRMWTPETGSWCGTADGLCSSPAGVLLWGLAEKTKGWVRS